MIDSRLQQAQALLDDARSLLIDIVDESRVDRQDANRIDAARQFINSALVYIGQADSAVTI